MSLDWPVNTHVVRVPGGEGMSAYTLCAILAVVFFLFYEGRTETCSLNGNPLSGIWATLTFVYHSNNSKKFLLYTKCP
jgi:hypothetical protein